MTRLRTLLKTLLPPAVVRLITRKGNARRLKEWEAQGRPAPPPHIVKQKVVEEYGHKFQCRVFVETGTYLGDMVEAQKENFAEIFSIELNGALFEKARRRFSKHHHISIIQGDSGEKLHELLMSIHEPALFWLDGHYSGGDTAKGTLACPIFGELAAILRHPEKKHIVLIDDARLFNGIGDYPRIDELREFFQKHNSPYNIEVKDDIIRCVQATPETHLHAQSTT